MATILLVDDDEEWQDLLSGVLAAYRVHVAGSYEEALAYLDDGTLYEVAIVDLNLITQKRGRRGRLDDRLGGDILHKLRVHHPAIRRIAITGSSPHAVEHELEQHDVDRTLFKQFLKLADVRDAVEESIELAWAGMPLEVRAVKSELIYRFSIWRKGRRRHFASVRKLWADEIREANSRGQPADYWSRMLADLNTNVPRFESECTALAQALADARSEESVAAVSQEFQRLKTTFGSDGPD